jgi:hypothetical protein
MTCKRLVPSHSKDKLNVALAMAGLASQMCAVFAVAVALGGPRTTPGPANPRSPTARAAKTLRGRCAAIWPVLQLELGTGRAKAPPQTLERLVLAPGCLPCKLCRL